MTQHSPIDKAFTESSAQPERGKLPQPLYESLPYLYCMLGVAALAWSYSRGRGLPGQLVTLLGLVALVGGAVLVLRRRDFRQLRDDYRGDGIGVGSQAEPGSSSSSNDSTSS